MLTALLGLASAAPAATPHAATILKAPYSGTAQTYTDSWGTGGCATAKIVKPAFWSPATGKGVIAGKASGATCSGSTVGGIGSSSFGTAGGEFDLGIPIPIAKTGPGHVVEHWKVRAALTSTLVAGTCTAVAGSSYACFQSATTYVNGYSYLYDTTNGSTFPSSNFWGGLYNDTWNSTTCKRGSCSFYASSTASVVAGPVSWFFNGSFDSTHSYALIVVFAAGASADLGTKYAVLSGGSASASANLGTLGNGAWLTSVKIS